jgi:hypothetical protein
MFDARPSDFNTMAIGVKDFTENASGNKKAM